MNFETLLQRVSAATLIRGLGQIHLNCFEIGYSEFNKNKPARWYSCSISPIQLGEPPRFPGLGRAEPECDGETGMGAARELSGSPARPRLPASRLPEQGRLWHPVASLAGLPRRGPSVCFSHGQGPGGESASRANGWGVGKTVKSQRSSCSESGWASQIFRCRSRAGLSAGLIKLYADADPHRHLPLSKRCCFGLERATEACWMVPLPRCPLAKAVYSTRDLKIKPFSLGPGGLKLFDLPAS